MARLTAPNGVAVTVADDKTAGLVARGYTTAKPSGGDDKTTGKKPAPSSKPHEK